MVWRTGEGSKAGREAQAAELQHKASSGHGEEALWAAASRPGPPGSVTRWPCDLGKLCLSLDPRILTCCRRPLQWTHYLTNGETEAAELLL